MRKTTDQQCLKIDVIFNENIVARVIELRNAQGTRRPPRAQRRTWVYLTLDTHCLLAEMPEVQVVPPPLPVELGQGSLEFKLLCDGDLPDQFSDLGQTVDPEYEHEYEITLQKSRTKRKAERCSAYKKLGHRSSNRNCKNYKATGVPSGLPPQGHNEPTDPPGSSSRRFQKILLSLQRPRHTLVLLYVLLPKHTAAGSLFSRQKLRCWQNDAQTAECCLLRSIDSFHSQLNKPRAIDSSIHASLLFKQVLYGGCTSEY